MWTLWNVYWTYGWKVPSLKVLKTTKATQRPKITYRKTTGATHPHCWPQQSQIPLMMLQMAMAEHRRRTRVWILIRELVVVSFTLGIVTKTNVKDPKLSVISSANLAQNLLAELQPFLCLPLFTSCSYGDHRSSHSVSKVHFLPKNYKFLKSLKMVNFYFIVKIDYF